MAEIISKNGKGNPRIDLTPMVDLGFLLITFFIFTTSLSEPKTMEIQMPVEGEPTKLAHHTAMTIFLSKAHKIFYYSGTDAMNNNFEHLAETDFTPAGIRQALLAHAWQVTQAYAEGLKGSSAKDFPFVIIKAGDKSEYSDLVNLLDELMISNIASYALMDMEPAEEKAIAGRML